MASAWPGDSRTGRGDELGEGEPTDASIEYMRATARADMCLQANSTHNSASARNVNVSARYCIEKTPSASQC
jgi:hypothetical protein